MSRSFLLGLFLALQAATAGAQIRLPAVPTGGVLQVTFSLSAAGFPALSGIVIDLTVANGCGSVNPSQVTTNAQGVAFFSFTAGQSTAACRIQGRSGAYVAFADTLVYRPSDVEVTSTQPRQTTNVNGSAVFPVKVTAAGHPLYGALVSVDPFPATGPSGSLVVPPSAANDSGETTLLVRTNALPGIYDFMVRFGSASRRLRVFQQVTTPSTVDPPGRTMRVRNSDGREMRISVLNGAAQCRVTSATYYDDPTEYDRPPPGTLGFPQGKVQMVLDFCSGTTQMSIEYPDALPADGILLAGANVTLPSAVNGRTVSFSITDNAPYDVSQEAMFFISTLGVAKPGQFPTPRPHPLIQDMWWSGTLENGWGMSIAQSTSPTNNLFSVIYAYDDAGKPTWWVLPGGFWDGTHTSFMTGSYYPRGTPYFAYDGKLTVSGDTVGKAQLTFPDANHGTLDYTINGITGRKTIQRQAFGVPGPSPQPNVGGMWYGGVDQAGWGIAIMQQQSTLFAVWFTYDANGFPTWFVMPGGTWTASDTYEGRMYRTRGAPWLGRTYDPAQFQVTDVGPYRFRFTGTRGTFEYQVDGVGGGEVMQRQAPF